VHRTCDTPGVPTMKPVRSKKLSPLISGEAGVWLCYGLSDPQRRSRLIDTPDRQVRELPGREGDQRALSKSHGWAGRGELEEAGPPGSAGWHAHLPSAAGPMGRYAVMLAQSDDNSQVEYDSRTALVSDGVDIVVGTAWAAARLTARLAAKGARMTAPTLSLVLRPPLVPRRWQPAHGMQLVVERWQRDRAVTLRALRRWSAAALPGGVDAALGQVDVEQVATVVLNRVDLDALVADTVRRLDVEAVILAVLQGVDLTRIASTAIESPDIDRVVRDALGRLDVDEVAAQLLDQVDLTQLVLDRVDLGRVVDGALDRLDLTSIVVNQVDLGGVVAAALRQVDLTQIVRHQVDLLALADYIVEGIDLPDIIRDSTGSVASEAVVGLRMQGVDADVVVGRIVDRMLRRHRERRSEKAPVPASSPDAPADPSGSGHE